MVTVEQFRHIQKLLQDGLPKQENYKTKLLRIIEYKMLKYLADGWEYDNTVFLFKIYELLNNCGWDDKQKDKDRVIKTMNWVKDKMTKLGYKVRFADFINNKRVYFDNMTDGAFLIEISITED